VLQIPCSAVVRELPRAIYKGSVGDATSSPLVDFKGGLSIYTRRSPLTRLKADEQAYALRSNEDVEMYDAEDDDLEEEAVLDELDGKSRIRLSPHTYQHQPPQPKTLKRRTRGKGRKKTSYPKRSRRETRTLNLPLDSKETVHTSYGATTSGCSGILGTRTKSGITQQSGTLPIQKARSLIPRRYSNPWR